ncbi:MAG: hypothetical protein D6722_13370 [Bacteroidetes bacterium]|nr:MAG: hypothetical protein D6722_13370 [Bacteroidota bacterium]
MLRYNILFLLVITLVWLPPSQAQSAFPDGWAGIWRGTLYIAPGPQVTDSLPMSLTIAPTEVDSAWQWTLQYGADDTRPYVLRAVDRKKGHYQIDERNSIVLDGFLFGSAFSSRFRVNHTLILISYKLRGETLEMEIISGPDNELTLTGEEVEEVEHIDSWPLRVRQVARLTRE